MELMFELDNVICFGNSVADSVVKLKTPKFLKKDDLLVKDGKEIKMRIMRGEV